MKIFLQIFALIFITFCADLFSQFYDLIDWQSDNLPEKDLFEVVLSTTYFLQFTFLSFEEKY